MHRHLSETDPVIFPGARIFGRRVSISVNKASEHIEAHRKLNTEGRLISRNMCFDKRHISGHQTRSQFLDDPNVGAETWFRELRKKTYHKKLICYEETDVLQLKNASP